MAQVVEYLPSKQETLSLNPRITPKKSADILAVCAELFTDEIRCLNFSWK
jgi:hypothetical protein